MTRGAGATPAWDVPGAWPGSGVPVAVSSVSKQSRFSDFLGGRDSSGVLPAGGAENTKAIGVLPDVGTFFSISGGTGCTGPYRFFSGISACAFDGETKFLVTGLSFCSNTFGVASPDATVLVVRGAELRDVVKFRLPVSSFSRVGFAPWEIAAKRPFPVSVVCLVLYMRCNEELNGLQQGLRGAVLSMDEQMVCVSSFLSV